MIFDTVKNIIANQLSINPDKVTEDCDIVKDLGLDSLDIVELVMALEEEWNIEADDDDIKTLHTVKDVVNYIETKTK